jgi:hypothetical protein
MGEVFWAFRDQDLQLNAIRSCCGEQRSMLESMHIDTYPERRMVIVCLTM